MASSFSGLRSMPQVKLVLLCSSSGQALAEEAQQRGCSLPACSQDCFITKALLPLAGTPVIEHWLSAAAKCRRLQPLDTTTVVVSHAGNHEQLQAWAVAAGLPASCVVSNGATASQPRRGAVADVALAVRHLGLEQSALLVVDCDHAVEPGYSLSHVVEAAMVRGRDTVMHTVPFEGADQRQLTLVELGAPGSMASTGGSCSSMFNSSAGAASSGSRVAALDAAATGTADGSTAVLAPLCVLMQPSVSALLEAADSGSCSCSSGPRWRHMGAFLQQQVQGGNALYSLPLDYHFPVQTLDDYLLTDAFFCHLLKLRAKLGYELKAADLDAAIAPQPPKEHEAALSGTVANLAVKLQTFSASKPAGSAVCSSRSSGPGALGGTAQRSSSEGGGSAGGLKQLFQQWFVQRLQEQAKEGQTGTARDLKSLPPRFQDATAWRHKPKQEHACYNTSNSAYGAKQPTAFDMPLVWAGAKGTFTETFHGGCYRSMGLATAVRRSKVHRELDEF